ncbi:GNAT family N-acetyltransferase [Lacticaseibacillus daqingensis]|uniref:GNAT family N-acetyltransferase n=1 Tax=Lacticaseibacillus daqingensis TaxID=2486014 RepID=UPI000F7A02C5|nr:GNAT family N-acetyltransferase [Lacticaseibacillus daqingensis]
MQIEPWTGHQRRLAHQLLLVGDEDPVMLAQYEMAGTLWAGLEAGALVCCALVVRCDATTLELKNLAVSPDKQGHGRGSAMLQFLVHHYRGQAARMLVGTGDAEVRNLRFYQRNGFHICGVRPNFFAAYAPTPRVNGVPLRDMVLLDYSLG